MAQENGPKINASLVDPCQGLKRFSVAQGDILGSLVGVDKHCRDIRQGKILKYFRGKATATTLNTLLLIPYLH